MGSIHDWIVSALLVVGFCALLHISGWVLKRLGLDKPDPMRADWNRRFDTGEDPDPNDPGGPASNAW